MQISILDVVGPIMIGPSSSHTAGAVALAWAAARLMTSPIQKVSFGLSGSFANTYKGHGTDVALVAGVLGMAPDDDRVPQAFAHAQQKGLMFDFFKTDLTKFHENTCLFRFSLQNGHVHEVIGCSLGGGRIVIRQFDSFETELYCQSPTLAIFHQDQRGVLSRITSEVASSGLNVAVLRCSRRSRGDVACTVIESDQPIPDKIKLPLLRIPGVNAVNIIQ